MSCTISELIALTRRARLFIGGDTGPLHLAAALRVPVVAIYGPTDPARNGPMERAASCCAVRRALHRMRGVRRRMRGCWGLAVTGW